MNGPAARQPAGRRRVREHAASADRRLRHHQARHLHADFAGCSQRHGGFHTLKAGYGFQHVVNDINTYYPGGFVQINWGGSFVFGERGKGHLRLLYEVNDHAGLPTRPA
ncbi:MAG: hypothetical protein R2708_25040 [Vicinamibacterales bacterium]